MSMPVEDKIRSISDRIVEARLSWWTGRRYDEAAKIYTEVEKDLERLISREESNTAQTRRLAMDFHVDFGRLMTVIGERSKAIDHFRKAHEFSIGRPAGPSSPYLYDDLPIMDVEAYRRHLGAMRISQRSRGKSLFELVDFGWKSLKLADALVASGRVEESRDALIQFLQEAENREVDEDKSEDRITLFVMSEAWKRLGDKSKSLSSLEKAAEISKKCQDKIDEPERDLYRRGLWYEETGAIFEEIDPLQALDYYEAAARCYARAVTSEGFGSEGPGSLVYYTEFQRHFGDLAYLFRYDTFARLAFRRQRLLAAIEGKAGYPIRRNLRK